MFDAVIDATLNLPACYHFAAVSRHFQEGSGLDEGSAMAAGKQFPKCEERKKTAVAALKAPGSGRIIGCPPQTRLFRATAAVPHSNASSE